MTDKDQPRGGGKNFSIGSILILFILKIVGGLSGLFHTKGTYSNMTTEEREVFSTMLDGMKQDLDKKDR